MSSVAARSFHIDPYFEWLEPKELWRARFLGLFFRGALRYSGPGIRATGLRNDQGRLLAVSAWVEPGQYPPSPGNQLRQVREGGRALALRPGKLPLGIKYLLAMDKAHPRDPVWYLLMLCVDPIAQRSGMGTALLEPKLEEIDRQGVDAYLETQKEENLAYYRRFGWEVDRVLRPVPGGPPLWTMRRRAQA